MANLSSIARPYALAAFEYAKEHQQLQDWKVYLNTAAAIATDAAMQPLLAHPERIGREALKKLFMTVLKDQLDKHKQNFFELLATYHRLNIFPEIAEAFNAFYEFHEKTSAVKLVTAVPVDEQYQEKISQMLTKRFHHNVSLSTAVDPSLIAGAMLYIGDKVIDASVRGQLSRLLEFSLR